MSPGHVVRRASAALILLLGTALIPATAQQPPAKPTAPPAAKPAPTQAAPPAAPQAQPQPQPPAASPPTQQAAPPPPTPVGPPKSFITQILVPGSHFHGVHGLAFDKDDQLFVGSVVGQSIYRVNVDSGEVDVVVEPGADGRAVGMADDIAFAPDGTMAWTGFLTGNIYVRKGNEAPRLIAIGLPGINSLAFSSTFARAMRRPG